MTTLLLADDHTMLREGLRRSLEAEGFEVLGEANNGQEAVSMAEANTPDVILMDVSMPVLDGIGAAQQIRSLIPDARIVMLTMHADADVIRKAIAAGAVGYLVKDCTTEEIVATLKQAADDETALSQELAASLLAATTEMEPAQKNDSGITKREEEVLQLIADGGSTSDVAEQLFISVKTVKNHLASIYQKLETSDRTQAVLRAARMGIIKLS